jgi:uncharacterized radical SAM protein YgiQ
VVLPSFEQVRTDKRAFAEMTRRLALESSPYCGRPMLQPHGDQAVFLNPPSRPLREDEMDALYDLPFQRRAHPGYAEDVPALETVRHSVVTLRGCFGGCSFCSISEHEGRVIQSRSGPGVLREVERLRRVEGFAGVVTDLGGPTANMYAMECKDEAAKRACRKPSCLHPSMCARLGDDHGPLLDLLRAVRAAPGVKRVFLASGIRCDLANRSPEFVRELAAHHTGGQLSVAPEHSDPKVLAAMRKPPIEEYDRFARTFLDASRSAGKEQYLVPYLISGHPGSTLEDTVELALALKARGLRPRQVQDFIPTPMSVATAMYHTGFDPTSGASVPTATDLRTKRMMKALLLYWDKESWPLAREALVRAGRRDLIGRGAHCLVPPDYGASASTPRGPQRHVRRARSS